MVRSSRTFPAQPLGIIPRGAPSLEQRVVVCAILCTWPTYAVGGLYVAGPVLAFWLLGLLVWRHAAAPLAPAPMRPGLAPFGAWAWSLGMAGMLAALIIAHAAEGLGVAATVKSAIGWAKGWWLLAAFIIAGSTLRLRPQPIVRALCWLAVQTALLAPVLVVAALLHLPSRLFVSPLQAVGGPGPEFFAVQLYITDPETHTPRWPFYAPWAPAMGMAACMMFAAALHEPSRRLRWAALCSSTAICLMTSSRMSLVFIATVPPLVWLLARITDRRLLAASAVAAVTAGIAAQPLLDAVSSGAAAFRGARASSSRVREALGRIAVERWWTEAWLTGHGVVTRGPHLVEHMPIGSHHTWYGVAYVKGVVGLASLALPLAWTLLEMLLLAQSSRMGRLGLTMTLLLVFYSFGENLEILPYLYYPALLLIGMASREAAESRRTASGTQPARAPTPGRAARHGVLAPGQG